jgi:hypothetical protein
MRSTLDDSVRRTIKLRRKKKGTTKRTKEAKVTSVDDGLCIFLANQLIQVCEVTSDISNAEYSAVHGVD